MWRSPRGDRLDPPVAREVSVGLLTLLLAACSSPTLTTPDCVSVSDCGALHLCVDGACVLDPNALQPCAAHTDCPGGSYCDDTTRRCTDRRRSCDAVECAPGTWCEAATGECRSGPQACAADDDCTDAYCDTALGVCRLCVDSAHCPAGWVCSAGACISERPECTNDGQCRPPTTVCEGALCVGGCGKIDSPVVCATDEVCDEATGRCIADGGCRIDLECAPPSTVCERGVCVAGCGAAGCGTGEVCDDTTGRCVPESTGAMCTDDSGCAPPVTVCEAQVCVAGCGQPNGPVCGAEEICEAGRCAPRPSCTSDAECPIAAPVCDAGLCRPGCDQAGGPTCAANEVCNAGTGRCELPRCATDADCAAPTPTCNTATGICYACAARVDCPTTKPECAPSGLCFACAADSECASPTPTCNAGACVGCASDADCSGTTPVCDLASGACRGCASNTECTTPPICSPSGQCTGCTSNADCAGATPACHVPSATCVECVTKDDCPASAPACDGATSTCIGCTSNADCAGATPACHVPSGLCLACVSNADCAAPTPTCAATTATCVGCATTGCPNGQVCGANGSCEAPLGALGATCNADADCLSSVCFDYGAGPRCTRSCGRPADCDAGFGCHMFSGARMCIPVASAPAVAEAIDCTTDADCGGGNRCVWLEEQPGRWDQRCRGALGPQPAQGNCNSYFDCQNGICSVGVQSPNNLFCRQPCDHDGQCTNGFFCTYISHPGQNFVQATKACVPVPSSFGSCSRDAQCAPNEVCQVIVHSMSGGLTYLYNGCAPR
ncbi:MAG: Dickkopf N-terminal cysteine-rich domain-containing protein [Deltaproteobacteria bacterium]